VNPQSPINESTILYDNVSPLETFLSNYISSCNHPIQTSFDSHHLVMLIYLIPITSRVRISIVIDHILRQCTSYYISTWVFSFLKILCLDHRPHIFQIMSYIITSHIKSYLYQNQSMILHY